MGLRVPTFTREELEYPVSRVLPDGRTVGQPGTHTLATSTAFLDLRRRFSSRTDVAICAYTRVDYEEGNPGASFWPDLSVAIGAPSGVRRYYELWREPIPPSFVLEVTGKLTWLDDNGNKKLLCQCLGVREYFLFDADAEYLDPVMQGFRLVDGEYVRIAPFADGSVESATLGLRLRPEGYLVRFVDAHTNEPLPWQMELEEQLRKATARLERLRALEGTKK